MTRTRVIFGGRPIEGDADDGAGQPVAGLRGVFLATHHTSRPSGEITGSAYATPPDGRNRCQRPRVRLTDEAVDPLIRPLGEQQAVGQREQTQAAVFVHPGARIPGSGQQVAAFADTMT